MNLQVNSSLNIFLNTSNQICGCQNFKKLRGWSPAWTTA